MTGTNMADDSRILSVLLVCMGNICRSPMAEGLLRHRLAERGLEDRVRLDSAGIGGWHAGAAPDPRAIRICAEHGIDIRSLRARAICADDYWRFDLILCADRDNMEILAGKRPRDATADVTLLLEWAGMAPPSEVPDPYTGDLSDFARVHAMLDRAAAQIVARLQATA